MPDLQFTVSYRPIEGFPGYRVGDDGSVSCSRRRGPGGRSKAWSVVKPCRARGGYARVTLSPGGVSRPVHRLVLEAFVGPRPEAMECRHENGKRDDNRVTNLSWGTPAENAADRDRHGRTVRGERKGNAKLTDSRVREMRAAFAVGGVTKVALARQFRVSEKLVLLVVTGRAWAHVT